MLGKKISVSCFLALLLVFMVVNTIPTNFLIHKRVREALYPYSYWLGIEQGVWSLFAPDPDNTFRYLVADFRFADGSKYLWISPRWETKSWVTKFIRNREVNFYSFLAEEHNQPVWEQFADYLVCQIVPIEGRGVPQKVAFVQHTGEIASPNRSRARQEFSERVEYAYQKRFFDKSYQREFQC